MIPSNEVPRLFESLDGNEPGTEPKSEDITGIPLRQGLPPMDDYPESGVDRQTGYSSQTGSERGIPELDESYGQRAPQRDEEPDSRSKNRVTARQRIAQLTQRYRQQENENSVLQQELAKLQSQIRAQEARLSSISRPQAPPSEESYGSTTAQPQSFDPNYIRQVIDEAIAPIRQQQEETARQSQLRVSQDRSFADALRELPGLSKAGSEEQEIFRELWEVSPLQSHPDGPLHVAYQVKGLLADERASAPEQEARKRAANVVRPGPTPGVPAPSGAGREKQKLYAEALERARTGRGSTEDYIIARKIQRDQNAAFPRRR